MIGPPGPALRRAGPLVLGALLCCLGVLVAVCPDVRPGPLLSDFNAFYCAGAAVGAGADPYRAEPLGACERRPRPAPLAAAVPGLAVPAPLPPYAMLPFIGLARLPYAAAAAIWTIVLFASVAIAVGAMRRLTGLPLVALIAAFSLTDGYASLCLGQVAPLCVAAICLAGMLLEQRRDAAAALVASLGTIEPHIALPACLALFVWRPRARVPLAAAALVAVGLSLLLTGPGTMLEYVRGVVPAHALAELANKKQFSLSYALSRFGLPALAAVRLGDLSYLFMLAAGTFAGGRLARRLERPSLLVALPPAFVLLGGPFVHIAQTAAALPAALLLYVALPGRLKISLAVAILALAVPWIQFSTLGAIFALLAGVATATLAATLLDERPVVVAVAAVLALGFVTLLGAMLHTRIGDPVPLLVAHYDPKALAEESWARYVAAVGAVDAWPFEFAKIPTLGALLTVCFVTLATLSPRAGRSRAPAHLSQRGNGAEAFRRTVVGQPAVAPNDFGPAAIKGDRT